MAISESFLRELHDRVNIEEIVSRYVTLKRRGKTLVGLCPFHNERTPSFTVYPDSNSFYCFGCGAGGDTVTFVRRAENLDYVEAVKAVAEAAGLKLPEDGFDDTLSKTRNRIFSANREAAKFYNKCLYTEGGKAALEYFKKRALTQSTITHFGLGYAPDSWNSLIKHMKGLGYTEQELCDANLARRSERDGKVNYYDNFRNRAMFPIIDLRGNVIAFGGRVLDDSKPKYINTSDTLVYKKSNGVYGLNFAKNTSEKKLILVEGYMDVIALHQAGFTEAIACLGTAFTTEQANLLSRYADEIFVCYDSDSAGQTATKRALAVLSSTGVKLRVVRLTGGKDPDEIIKTYGAEKFRALLTGAANRIEYDLLKLRETYDLATDDGKMNFLNAAADVLAACSEIERDIYAGRLSVETGVAKEAIISKARRKAATLRRREEETRKAEQSKKLMNHEDKNNPERSSHLAAAKAEEVLIASLARNPDFYRKLKDKLSPDIFVTSFNRRLFKLLLARLESGEEVELGFFSADFTPAEMDSVTRIFHIGSSIANTLSECEDCIKVLTDAVGSTAKNIGEMSPEEYLKMFE